jgi:phosphoribosylaminoimidazole-succinocarboxamide synthase
VPSFDKQYVREWLETQSWDKNPPPPDLPAEIVEGSRARYVEAFERITGASFADYLTGDTT